MDTHESHVKRKARVIEMCNEVFADPEKAKRWLQKPLKSLGDKCPLDALETEEGVSKVENLFGKIDAGYFA